MRTRTKRLFTIGKIGVGVTNRRIVTPVNFISWLFKGKGEDFRSYNKARKRYGKNRAPWEI